MKSFIIHSTKDKEQVDKIISLIKKSIDQFEPLMLEKGGIFWKFSSKKKIKDSQIIIFVVGENSHISKYIGWEIKTALKYNKIISLIKIDENYKLHESLAYKDNFSNKRKYAGRIDSTDSLITYLIDYEKDKYQLFNSLDNKEMMFEQYKLFLTTSENLIERRQKISSFYVSANTLLVTIAGLLFALKIETTYKLYISVLFAVIGIILSISWTTLLTAYGSLNSSKMKVLSIIEKELPITLFDSEWVILNDRLNNRKYTSITSIEKRIPITFIGIYLVVLVITIVALIFSFLK